jgi:hypothetical protein
MAKTRCPQFIGRESSGCTLSGFSHDDHLDDDDDECPYVTADECATARERDVAGISDRIEPCPVHGPHPDEPPDR